MASEILVPVLGESVSEATVAQWLKQVGDSVAADEPLVELETDKVTLEVNAPEAGVLSEILVEEGGSVEVGALLGRIGAGEGKKAEPAAKESKAEAQTSEAAAEPEPSPAPAAKPSGNGEAAELRVPSLGESVSEATVGQWLKQAGEAVAADEPLVELETDKVTLEVNAPTAGTLSEILAEEGASVEVGALLARIAPGEGAAEPKAQAKPAAKQTKAAQPAALEAGERGEGGANGGAGAPALDAARMPRSGPDGKVTRADLERFLEENTAPAAMTLSPAVAKLVAEQGLDPNRIRGTGPQGRITKSDVIDFMEGRQKPPAAPEEPAAKAPAAKAPEAPSAPGAREERVRMSKLRQTIARRLKEAQNTAAMLTTFNEADMSAVMALRAQFKEAFEKKHGVKLGFMSFFAKACVAALQELPAVNARIEGEEMVYAKHYDLGIAVSTPNGLMVPVVRDADRLSFAGIEKAINDLGTRARDGKLSLEEMQGGTFTITNGGIFGSLLSTPILNMPQGAILGMHKIQERPMAVNGQVEIRPMMYLALSYDHRLIDGREAVTFLVRVKAFLEDPQRLLLDL